MAGWEDQVDQHLAAQTPPAAAAPTDWESQVDQHLAAQAPPAAAAPTDWESQVDQHLAGAKQTPTKDQKQTPLQFMFSPHKELLDATVDGVKTGLKGLLRGITYPINAATSAAAIVAAPFAGKHVRDVVSDQDAKDVLNPFSMGGPSASEYADRLGIPKGPALSDVLPLYGSPDSKGWLPKKGGALDPTVRGALLTAAQVAADPMNKILSKAGTNVASSALQEGGDAMYRSGFKNVDKAVEDLGKGPNAFSNSLLNNGRPAGTTYQVKSAMQDIIDKLMQKRDDLYAASKTMGANPNMEAAVKPAADLVQKMKMTGNYDPELIEALKEKVANTAATSPIDLAAASGRKTALYDAVPGSKWSNAAQTNVGQQVQKTLAKGIKDDIENQAEKVIPGAGEQIGDINNNVGPLLTGQNAMSKQIGKAVNKNLVTSVDPMVYELGKLASGGGSGLPLLAAKKAADLGRTTWFRTNFGNLMNSVGKQQVLPVDTLLRQNAWGAMNQAQPGENK